MTDKILMIIKREKPEPHYELHLSDKVKFVTLEGKDLGESIVKVI
jgi:hypothetical protein